MDCHRTQFPSSAAKDPRPRKNTSLLISLTCLLLVGIARVQADNEPAILSAKTAAAQSAAIVDSFRHDAALSDVCFIDRSTGWAVGDRGVIWHTDDGGGTWQQQASTVACALKSVAFIDARCGWIVGGESRPYGAASRGVVLRTDDGGTTWKPIERLTLPLLRRVQFFDAQRGVAIGDSSPSHPFGVFITQDSGDTWQPLPANRVGGWIAGDFLDPETGSVAGSAGRFATLTRREIVHSPLATESLHSLRAMQLIAPTGGWLVGEGGIVMTTGDLGRSWQNPPAALPDVASDHFDFQALAVAGTHVWVAGSPGTRVFHTDDGGHTWSATTTGQTAPIRAITFADHEHGWAVGDLGNILVTQDGGRSWQSQRSVAKRAAMLAVFADPADVPLELIADTGAAEGYVTAIDILHTNAKSEAAADQSANDRACQSLLLAGAAAANVAWRFPVPPNDLALAPADYLAALNRENDGRAIVQLERHLVRNLRMWRPEVVVTYPTKLTSIEPRAALVAALIWRSIEAAADPTRHIELASDASLQPWQVKKVYGLLPLATRGGESLASGRFSPWLGTTLTDFVTPARQLLEDSYAAPPDAYEFQLVMSQVGDESNSRGLFSGISLAPGSEARRPQTLTPASDLADVRGKATHRRHLEELLERSEGNAAWTGQVAHLINELNENDGAQLLMQLAEGYRQTGRLDLAADTYYLLARRFPNHPLADRALMWLVQFYASSEAAHRATPRGRIQVNSTASSDNTQQPEVQQASAIAPIDGAPAVGLSRDDRRRRAVQLAEYLMTSRPALYAEPTVRFAEVCAQRQLGFANPAKRYFLTLRQLPEDDYWRQCAAIEEWLADPEDTPPTKAIATCRHATNRPHLDGQLDEPFWNTADKMRLRGDKEIFTRVARNARGDKQEAQPRVSELRLAYDREHLYIAIQCPRSASPQPPAPILNDSPRPRDADLTPRDRVTLRLDTDRDFTTAFELTVDHRGWTHEACWADANWNPEWYVAAAGDAATWTVEAAIPLDELAVDPPAARHVWAVAARRTIPRVGYESWSGAPAATDSPDQFGLLIFE